MRVHRSSYLLFFARKKWKQPIKKFMQGKGLFSKLLHLILQSGHRSYPACSPISVYHSVTLTVHRSSVLRITHDVYHSSVHRNPRGSFPISLSLSVAPTNLLSMACCTDLSFLPMSDPKFLPHMLSLGVCIGCIVYLFYLVKGADYCSLSQGIWRVSPEWSYACPFQIWLPPQGLTG